LSGLHLRIESPSRVRLRFVGDERLVELVREGNRAAFEAVYDRHAAGLLSFCVYMLGSHHDAEDAVQATFASAHKALLKDDRDLALRPWLFVIARNACLTIIRKRRAWVELNGEPAVSGDPVHSLEVNEDVRHLLDGLRGLPEPQRAALVMAEVQGLSQREISAVMGVRPTQVKAYAYQARANLIAERQAREADCEEIREALAAAHGAGRLRGPLRRHLSSCDGCRAYQRGLRHQSRVLGALFPVVPSLALKARALQDTIGSAAAPAAAFTAYRGGAAVSGGVAGTAALAGGGFKAILAVVAGVACVGACGVGVSLLGVPGGSEDTTPVPAASGPASHMGAGVLSDVAQVSTHPESGGASGRAWGGAAHAGAGRGDLPRAATPEGPQPSTEAGSVEPESATVPGVAPWQGAAVETAPAARTSEHSSETGSERRQETGEQKQAALQRRSRVQARRTGGSEKHVQSREEHVKARERQKQTREQQTREREEQAKEREEQARSMHGLPPELRRAEHEKQKAEREEQKAEKEREGAR